jgi:hypothetical protein
MNKLARAKTTQIEALKVKEKEEKAFLHFSAERSHNLAPLCVYICEFDRFSLIQLHASKAKCKLFILTNLHL